MLPRQLAPEFILGKKTIFWGKIPWKEFIGCGILRIWVSFGSVLHKERNWLFRSRVERVENREEEKQQPDICVVGFCLEENKGWCVMLK